MVFLVTVKRPLFWTTSLNHFQNISTDKQSSNQLIWHPFRKTRTTSRGLARNWNLKMNSHPPTNEISVGGLGESGPDVAVEIWQIGIFSNLSAHRATSVHLLKLWDNFCKRGLVFQITSTFLFNKHPQQTAWTMDALAQQIHTSKITFTPNHLTKTNWFHWRHHHHNHMYHMIQVLSQPSKNKNPYCFSAARPCLNIP